MLGFFSFIHHHQIIVLGHEETQYFSELPAQEYSRVLEKLFSHHPCMLLFADDEEVPARILARAEKYRLPVLSSSLPGHALIEALNHELSSHFAATLTMHGVFMDVLGVGVLLTGASGIGKSELALGLINCNHRLVADDAVIFSRVAADTLVGSCPPLLQDFLEVRGLGIINIRAMFGDNAIKDSKRLQLIVNVVIMNNQELRAVDRLDGSHSSRNILGIDVAEVTIPVAPGRNLAVLVEGAVRNQILKFTGYNANEQFIQRQQQQIEDSTT